MNVIKYFFVFFSFVEKIREEMVICINLLQHIGNSSFYYLINSKNTKRNKIKTWGNMNAKK